MKDIFDPLQPEDTLKPDSADADFMLATSLSNSAELSLVIWIFITLFSTVSWLFGRSKPLNTLPGWLLDAHAFADGFDFALPLPFPFSFGNSFGFDFDFPLPLPLPFGYSFSARCALDFLCGDSVPFSFCWS